MKRVFAVLLALLLLVLSGCGSKAKDTGASVEQHLDYETQGQWVSGGEQVQNANAKEVKVTSGEGEELRVEVSFVLDSKISGSGSESAVPGNVVPAYSVCVLPSPARLVIEFDALSYWDYARNFDPSGAAHVLGWFEHMLADSDAVSLYLQLDTACAYKVVEEAGKLVVLLQPIAQPEAQSTPHSDVTDITDAGSKFYVTANAYRDYCNGVLSREMDMQPTLSEAGDNVLLISKGFDTPTQAENFKNSTLKLNPNAVEAEWRVTELSDNVPPPYSQELEYAAAYTAKAARVNGEEITPELLIPDGLLLCAQPGGNGLLYSKRIVGGDVRDEYEYEELYLLERSGATRRLLRYEFETIETASYSPDGRKLAVLERSSGASHLYIFDVDTKELLVDLASVGFGDTISSFTWDAMGTIVFAVSGSSGMQVNQYDFNIPEESKRFSVVDKKGADEGSICYLDGEVYFFETEMTGSTIYKIKPEGGLRKPFFSGGSFALSSDGERMAISAASGDTLDGTSVSSLIILDMASGQSTLVEEDFAVYDLLWSGDVLYYIENRLSGDTNEGASAGDEDGDAQQGAAERDEYPYTLWMFDGENKVALADLSTTSVIAVGENGIAVCYSDAQTLGKVVRATYVLK